MELPRLLTRHEAPERAREEGTPFVILDGELAAATRAPEPGSEATYR